MKEENYIDETMEEFFTYILTRGYSFDFVETQYDKYKKRVKETLLSLKK